MPKFKTLYSDHIKARMEDADKALSALNYSSLILGSGEPYTNFEDDSEANFKPNPHFAHWCPAKGPHHFIKYEPGKKPLLVYYAPDDFWHSHEQLKDPFWTQHFDIISVGDKGKLWESLGNLSYSVFIGNETKYACAAGVKTNCEILTARLNWYRRYKSDYEILCLSEANKLAAKGHQVAKEVFFQGGSEYEIHMSYLLAMQVLDSDLPYTGIVGVNENSAVLHYHKKGHHKNGKVLLIDSGASHNHYGADITRTYASENCEPLFTQILEEAIRMQLQLCEEVKPGLYYPHLHEKCHLKIAAILEKVGVLKINGDYEKALNEGLTKTFFPHGLGHMLGVQVHDIGGKQLDEQGNIAPINPANVTYRSLRFVGTLEENVVVTIEPGIYFIPMLLNKLKENDKLAKYVNWNLIDRLIPCGGIRIEDDVLVTKNSSRNLTREFLD